MKFVLLVLFTTLLLGAACTHGNDNPEIKRLENDYATMSRDAGRLEGRIRSEGDVGKRHELTSELELLKSRMERVKVRLEAERAKY